MRERPHAQAPAPLARRHPRSPGRPLDPRVDGRPVRPLRSGEPARAAGPLHRPPRPRRHRPRVPGRPQRHHGLAVGDDDRDARRGAGWSVRPAPRRVLRPLAAQPAADPRAPGGRPSPGRGRAGHVRPADPVVRPPRLGRADLGGGRGGEVQPPTVGADHRRLRREVRPPRRPGRPRGPRLPALRGAAPRPRGRSGHDRARPSPCSSATPSAA